MRHHGQLARVVQVEPARVRLARLLPGYRGPWPDLQVSEEDRSGRRGFFRMGAKKLRDNVIDAVKAFEHTTAAAADSVTRPRATPATPPQFWRDRVRSEATDVPRRVIRPPGALPEAAFLQTCEKCRKCLEACPHAVISLAGPQYGRVLEVTPMITLSAHACQMCPELPCSNACPIGALKPVPLVELRMGTARAKPSLCLNTIGQRCEACFEACPRVGAAAIVPGDDGVPVVSPESCTGCGQCVVACRAFPKALEVEPV